MLARNELVFLLCGDLRRLIEHSHQFLRKIKLAEPPNCARMGGMRSSSVFDLLIELLDIDAGALEHRDDKRLLVFEQCGKQMERLQLAVILLCRDFLRILQCFLRLNGKTMKVWHWEI